MVGLATMNQIAETSQTEFLHCQTKAYSLCRCYLDNRTINEY